MTDPASTRVGTTYNVQPAASRPRESTDWLHVAPLRIGIEYRKLDPAALAREDLRRRPTRAWPRLEERLPRGRVHRRGCVDPRRQHRRRPRVRALRRLRRRTPLPLRRPGGRHQHVGRSSTPSAHGPVMPQWMLGQLRHRLPVPCCATPEAEARWPTRSTAEVAAVRLPSSVEAAPSRSIGELE